MEPIKYITIKTPSNDSPTVTITEDEATNGYKIYIEIPDDKMTEISM
jgi:hypothetical protein